MPRPIDIQAPPACTTPDGAKELQALMDGIAQKLVVLGGDPNFVSSDNRWYDLWREKKLGNYVEV